MRFDFKKLSISIQEKLKSENDDTVGLRKICKETGLHVTFLMRVIHYEKYQLQGCKIDNLVLLLEAFELNFYDFVIKKELKNVVSDCTKIHEE